MISELTFIRSYTTFWKSLFPGGDDFVRLINSALGERFEKPLEFNDLPNRRALVNGIGFSLFEMQMNQELSNSDIQSLKLESKKLKSIESKEIKFLSNIWYLEKYQNGIDDSELAVIKSLSLRLSNRYSRKSTLEIRPKFRGCGILFEATGDVVYNNTLAEIKAGDRSFSIQDIRQLYVYLALNHQSKEFKLEQIELYNPRTGLVWNSDIDLVSENIAGSSTIEIYNEIINFVSNDNRSL